MGFFFFWVMLEMMSLLFCTILAGQHMGSGASSSIKYFISQAPASIALLASFLLINTSPLASVIMCACLLFKLGLPPFHGWVFNITMDMNYFTLTLMLTSQKLIPLIMLSNLKMQEMKMVVLSIFLSFVMLLFTMSSVNNMYYIMVLSSIVNTYWVLLMCLTSYRWLSVFMFYSVSVILLTILMNSLCLHQMKDLVKINMAAYLMLVFLFLNISAIPPFPGFYMKISALKLLLTNNFFLVLFMLWQSVGLQYLYFNLYYTSVCARPNLFKFMNVDCTTTMKFILLLSPISLYLFSWFTQLN